MKHFLFFAISLLAAVFCYLMFAYGNWDIDAGNWTEQARWLSAMLIFFIVAVINIIPIINKI